MTGEKEPQVRIVDRRWWAREETTAGAAEPLRKPTYVEELERQLADSGTRLQAVLADHRRSLEEFEQARARMRRDVAREVERGRRAILADLLDVVDNLDRAIAAGRDAASPEGLTRGVELVRDQFLDKLHGFGVARIEALGRPFDPERHDAAATRPVDDPSQDGMVVSVVREGYAIGDDVLRPSSVVVGGRRE